MFSHKKVREIKRGNPIPNNSKYLNSIEKEVNYGWGSVTKEIYDVYEIPCDENGSTELKVTYETRPAPLPSSSGPCCGQRDCYCS